MLCPDFILGGHRFYFFREGSRGQRKININLENYDAAVDFDLTYEARWAGDQLSGPFSEPLFEVERPDKLFLAFSLILPHRSLSRNSKCSK